MLAFVTKHPNNDVTPDRLQEHDPPEHINSKACEPFHKLLSRWN